MKTLNVTSTLAGIVVSMALASPSMADAWAYAGDSSDKKVYTYSENKATSIAIGCDRMGLYFDLYFLSGLAGWQGNGDVSLVVGQQAFPVVALDGGSDYARLFTRADGQDGVSEALISAMSSGSVLTIEGAATAKMKESSRTYGLNGSADAISQIRRQCGQ